jgi:hypothetical protein
MKMRETARADENLMFPHRKNFDFRHEKSHENACRFRWVLAILSYATPFLVSDWATEGRLFKQVGRAIWESSYCCGYSQMSGERLFISY